MLSLFVIGCHSEPATTNPQPSGGDGPEQADHSEGDRGKGMRAPLTGLEMEGDGNHPIVMAMINNHPKARPQTGLNRADIVFEVLAEGEITRFAAFYHSRAEGTIGPVRSARPYYLDLAEGFDAVVAHAGGSDAAKERFTQPGYPSLDGIAGGETYFWREEFREAPHNLYTSMERLLQGASEKGYSDHQNFPQLLFTEDDEEVESGSGAGKIHIAYGPLYDVGYTYDAAAETYTRLTHGEEQFDLETEVPLTMANVLALKAPHRVLDEQGRREIGLTGSGEGWLFQKGGAREIKWQYENGFPQPYAGDEPLPLIPGKTWINIIPAEATVHYSEQ